jgi:hypothetical protein
VTIGRKIMSDLDVLDIDPEFYQLIGRIASSWAWLEMTVNDCLWALCGAPYGAGACVTAQIYSFDSRMKSLVALLELKKVDQKFIDKVNAFHQSSRCSLAIRNRCIHDVWGHIEGEPQRLTITVEKKLKFEVIPKKIEEMREDLKTVEKTVLTFESIRSTLRGFLMTLPDTRPLAIQGIFFPHDQRQTPSTGEKSPISPPQSSPT